MHASNWLHHWFKPDSCNYCVLHDVYTFYTVCSEKIYNTFDDDKQFDVTKKYVLL